LNTSDTRSRMRYYADVIGVLSAKDFKIRYRNSALGFLWSLLNPLASMTILTVVFSLLLRSNIPNYAAWLLIGLLVWRFFQIGTSQSLYSILGNPSLVSKIYVKRYILVFSNNLANFLGCVLEFAALLPLLLWLGVKLSYLVLIFPLLLLLEFLLIFALSLSLSALNMKYRDLFQIWEIATQLGFFLSPIFYSITLIPARFQTIYSLNPVTQLIQAGREMLLFGQYPSASAFIIIVASIVILLIVGSLIFFKLEKRFAEEL